MPDGLPHDIVLALGGASGLAAIYTVVRIVSAVAKTLGERRVADSRVVHLDAETRRALDEATEAGVGALGELVVTLRSEVTQLRVDIRDLGHRYMTFRGRVLRFIGEMAAILPDMPTDVRDRVQGVITRFREDAES